MSLKRGDSVSHRNVALRVTGQGWIMDIFGPWAWVKWHKIAIPQTVALADLEAIT